MLFCLPDVGRADLLCVKKSVKVKKGAVNLASALKTTTAASCASGYALVKDLNSLKDFQLVGFASADSQGNLKNFGGNGVTSVTVSQDQNGGDTSYYRFTFSGKFSALTTTATEGNKQKVTVLSTPISFDYPGLSVSVASASSSEIKVDVGIWKTDALSPLSYQGGVYIALLVGQTPS